MAILEILTFPNPVLRQKALPVVDFNTALEKIVSDMFDTMYDAPGVGLAANQVGILQHVAVIDVDYDVEGEDEKSRKLAGKNPRIFVNAEILERTGSVLFKEGCLSVPGFSEQVKRFEKIRVRFQDLQGKNHELETEGLLAVALQHEMDHLEGRLFIDRLSEVKRGLIKNKILKHRPESFERSRFHVEL